MRARVRMASTSAPESPLACFEEDGFRIGRGQHDAGLLHGHVEHGEPFLIGAWIEQRDVLFGAALAFEVDGQQVGTRGEEEPDHFAAIFGVAHELRDLREDAAGDAAIAAAGAIAELRVGFVHDHGDGAHGFQQVEDALQVAFGDALPHAAEILERDGGNADFAGETGSEERLAGAHGAADHIAHRHHVGAAGADGLRGVVEALLGRLVAGDHREIEAALHELEQDRRPRPRSCPSCASPGTCW